MQSSVEVNICSITLANNNFLADKLRLFQGYIGVSEFENGTSSGQLALLFVILQNYVFFSIRESVFTDTI